MIELDDVSTRERVWHVFAAYFVRDWRVHLRSPLAITGTLAGPFLLMLAIGVGLGSTVGHGTEHQILTVIVPGLAAMSAVLVCSQRSITVFSDRASGLTDEVLAGPVSAGTIVLAQTLSSGSIATLHGLVMFGLSAALGLAAVPAHWLIFLVSLVVFAVACAAACNALGILARRPGSIQALLNLLVNPLFFLSGALFDVGATATPIRIIALLNPFHYGVRLLQGGYSPGAVHPGSVALSVAVLAALTTVAVIAGARSLRRT